MKPARGLLWTHPAASPPRASVPSGLGRWMRRFHSPGVSFLAGWKPAPLMHVRELVELAALVAVHSPAFARQGNAVPQPAIEQYWVASKCRIERWLRLLRRLTDAAGQLPQPAALAWPRVLPALEEILASEILSRIWTAAAVAHDE